MLIEVKLGNLKINEILQAKHTSREYNHLHQSQSQ